MLNLSKHDKIKSHFDKLSVTEIMDENLKDILAHLNPDIDHEMLLLYLQGKLTAGQQHEIEKQMMNDDFNADALEGLENFKNKKDINTLVEQLNSDLKKRTEKKKRFKEKWKRTIEPWLLFAVVLILLLVIIAYMVVRHQLHH